MTTRLGAVGAGAIALLAWAGPARSQAIAPGETEPRPADPYPLNAAGWGPPAGNGRFMSRWVEDWTGMRAAGDAPPLKAVPVFGEAALTLSAELRLRYDAYDNGQLIRGDTYDQGDFRGILGADLRFDPHVRAYGEIGTAQTAGWPGEPPAIFQNDASLQQLFVDARGSLGSTLVGGLVGRQEFADGPQQIMSIVDGPTLRRTWNGIRLYTHDRGFRLGAFDLLATRHEHGWFDDGIDDRVRLRGVDASVVVSSGPDGADTYLDPFWYHTTMPGFRAGGRTGLDERDTYGVRLWGRKGDVGLDWTFARQTGEHSDRDVDAWGLFLVHSLLLSEAGWRPRLTGRVDVASGGGADSSRPWTGFNQLYGGANYWGEGLFLSGSNLLLATPGVSLSPTPDADLSIEYGFAWRLREDDAAYAGLMRPYPGTQDVAGREIGRQLSISGRWLATDHVRLFANFEHLAAGEVLKRAGLPSGSFGRIGLTVLY